MSNIPNVPDVLSLDEEGAFALSIGRAWLDVFPPELREHARFKVRRLHHAMASKEISAYALLSAAYIGIAPLPTSYRRFNHEAQRINKLEPNPPVFRKNEVARDNSAAEEFGLSRGELKRLYGRLDDLAYKFGGLPSHDAVFNCRNEVLNDQSAFTPAGREAYAKGPLHLWDFAKIVNKHKLDTMSFGTLNDWILFVHLEGGVVSGHAIHPSAHRFGDLRPNPLIDAVELSTRVGHPSPIIEVPLETQEAVKSLAERRFPSQRFEFVR